jgi:hypothetical protein
MRLALKLARRAGLTAAAQHRPSELGNKLGKAAGKACFPSRVSRIVCPRSSTGEEGLS